MRTEDLRQAAQNASELAKAEMSPDKDGGELAPHLARGARAEYRASRAAEGKALMHALNCGEFLLKAKEEVDQGNWLRWLKAEFPASKSTAENYMHLSRHRSTIEAESQRVGHMSIREALAFLKPISKKRDGKNSVGSGDKVAVATAEGAKKELGKGPRGQKVSPEPVIYSVGDIPTSQARLETVLGEGHALVLRSDAPTEAERALGNATSFIEAAVRASWAGGRDARLLILCAGDPDRLEEACGVVATELAEEGDSEEATDELIEQYERRVIREVEKERDDRSLYQIVKEQGGIKPPPENGRVKEYKEIPSCYKRKNGLAGDEMADYLDTHHPEFGIFCENDLVEYFARRRMERAA